MRYLKSGVIAGVLASTALLLSHTNEVKAHGDVVPQAVDTSGLPKLGKEWLEENPWRNPKGEYWAKAVSIGASGYNQNCARCHGLEVISGGLAPDLRYLEADVDGDEWFLERFKLGYTQNGITKMPAFGELLSQEAAWAIKTYVESRPDEGALDAYVGRLKEIKEILLTLDGSDDLESKIKPLKDEMTKISLSIETGSGAPVADSAASRAAANLDGSPNQIKNSVEALTVGLSAAK